MKINLSDLIGYYFDLAKVKY